MTGLAAAAGWAVRAAPILLALPPAIAAVAVWRAVPNGWLLNEDFQILYEFANRTVARALFAPAFGHLDTTRNGVMGLIFAAAGVRPAVFFAVGLCAHALNAMLLYRLAARLSGRPLVASAAAVMWALSPLHAGTLGWIAAHGQVWITALALLMLDRLAVLEAQDRRLGGGEAVLWAVGVALINTCYTGIAFLLPLAVLIIGGRRISPAALVAIGSSVVLFAVAYLLANAAYPPAPIRLEHMLRPSLAELLPHAPAIAVAALHLVVVPVSALLLGQWFEAAAYPSWPAVTAAAGFAVVLLAAWRAAVRRRWILGLLLLGLSPYPLIAVLRIVITPDEPIRLALAPQYHYFAQATLAVLAAVGMASLRAARPRLVDATVAGWAAALLVVALVWPPAVDLRAGTRRQTERALAAIRAAVAAAPAGGTVYLPNRPFPPMVALSLLQGDWKFPGLAGVFVLFFPGDEVDGRRVRFVAADPAALIATADGGRIATLLVPPTPASP